MWSGGTHHVLSPNLLLLLLLPLALPTKNNNYSYQYCSCWQYSYYYAADGYYCYCYPVVFKLCKALSLLPVLRRLDCCPLCYKLTLEV